MLEDNRLTSQEIVKGLHNYYVTNEYETTGVGTSCRVKGKVPDDVPEASDGAQSKGKGKRRHESKCGSEAPKGCSTKKQGSVPRITRADYSNLSLDESLSCRRQGG
jgi:hypothetical protein